MVRAFTPSRCHLLMYKSQPKAKHTPLAIPRVVALFPHPQWHFFLLPLSAFCMYLLCNSALPYRSKLLSLSTTTLPLTLSFKWELLRNPLNFYVTRLNFNDAPIVCVMFAYPKFCINCHNPIKHYRFFNYNFFMPFSFMGNYNLILFLNIVTFRMPNLVRHLWF